MSVRIKDAQAAVLLGCTFYATNGIFLTRIHEIPIPSIIFYRLFFGFLLIATFIIIRKKSPDSMLRKKRRYLLMLGIFTSLNMFFYFVCVSRTCVSIAILLE
jgi:drug/metabolite transporter (DMT)-like permease